MIVYLSSVDALSSPTAYISIRPAKCREESRNPADIAGQLCAPQDEINRTPHVSYHISLEDFTPHYARGPDGNPDYDKAEIKIVAEKTLLSTEAGYGAYTDIDGDADNEPIYYTHPCRCSSQFVITLEDLEEGVEVVGCEGCGEWVRVGYEVLEEPDMQGEGQEQELK